MNAARASLLALLLCWAASALALVAVPPLSGRVVDQTGTLSAGDIAALTQTLRDLETRKGSQIAVLIVPGIYLFVRWYFVPQAVVIEGARGAGAEDGHA